MKVSLLRSLVLLGLLCAGSAVLVAPAHAQDEEEEPFQSGLIADYTDATGRSAQRIDREVRFVWSRHAPDERLAAGKFRVRWRGLLMSQADGTYQLHVHAAGKVRVQLRGETVLSGERVQPGWLSSKPLDLSFDYHPLEIEFESPSGSPRLGLYWSGPQFQLEPVSSRQLFHDRTASIPDDFSRGARLVAALRCAACHDVGGGGQADAAPALDHLAGNLHDAWLRDYLAERPAPAHRGPSETATTELSRRMPYWQLKKPEIEAITAYLFAKSLPTVSLAARAPKDMGPARPKSKANRKKKSDESTDPPQTPREAGRELVHTVGCLACHRIDGIGSRGLYDGGDLSEIARKRPRDFFVRWLAAPASMNAQHRMPLFELNEDEQRQIGAYLAELGTPPANARGGATTPAELIQDGERLFAAQRCGACHVGPSAGAVAGTPSEAPARTRLSAESNWTRSCAGDAPSALPGQPSYRLGDADQQAIQGYVSGVHPASAPQVDLTTTLERRNCLACHAREGRPGLAAQLGKLAERDAALAPRIPYLTPPSLDSIGDKLHDGALRDSIRRQGPVHRPYLAVRMPRFQLTDEELESLVEALVTADRIPDGIARDMGAAMAVTATRPAAKTSLRTESPLLLEAVGSRLVTQDGFGCTSCHAVGSVQPAQAPLNARG
ncbi:MAG: c-type cytochrome, partial [Pirellulaceae bacterium]